MPCLREEREQGLAGFIIAIVALNGTFNRAWRGGRDAHLSNSIKRSLDAISEAVGVASAAVTAAALTGRSRMPEAAPIPSH